MNKEELLKELSVKINSGEISYDEMIHRFNLTPITNKIPIQKPTKTVSDFSITNMLYVLGATIVIIGIILFTYQIWNDIGSLGRIFVTLGLGLLITASGSFILNNKKEDKVGTVFHFIGGMLIPGGALVMLSEFSTGQPPEWPLAITFGIIFAFYLFINSIHKSVILTFFTIVNGTAFIYLFMNAILGDSYNHDVDIYSYLTMIIGLSYLLLSYSFKNTRNARLIEIFNFLGTIGLFIPTFLKIFDSLIWQFFYLILVIGGFVLSIYVKSRSILLVSTLALLSYVSYITSEYFADSVGWPISLVVLGFVFIALGYMSIIINKKYIKN